MNNHFKENIAILAANAVYEASCRGTLGELYQGPCFDKDSVDIAIISALSNNKTSATLIAGRECNLEAINKLKVKKALENFSNLLAKEPLGQWSMVNGQWSMVI